MGRPKNSFKWEIDGVPCKAQEFYKHNRKIKRLSELKTTENKFNQPLQNKRLNELIEIRAKVEDLIKLELEVQLK